MVLGCRCSWGLLSHLRDRRYREGLPVGLFFSLPGSKGQHVWCHLPGPGSRTEDPRTGALLAPAVSGQPHRDHQTQKIVKAARGRELPPNGSNGRADERRRLTRSKGASARRWNGTFGGVTVPPESSGTIVWKCRRNRSVSRVWKCMRICC